jgi:hypothetical protein
MREGDKGNFRGGAPEDVAGILDVSRYATAWPPGRCFCRVNGRIVEEGGTHEGAEVW